MRPMGPMQCLQRRPSAGRRLFSTATLPTPGTLPTSSAASASLPSADASVLTDADISRFNQDGAIVLRGTFAPWVEAMREGAEANLSEPGPLCDEHAAAAGTGGRFHDDQFLWHRHAIFADFVLRAGAGAIAARAMGSRTAQSEARLVAGERPSRHGCCSSVHRRTSSTTSSSSRSRAPRRRPRGTTTRPTGICAGSRSARSGSPSTKCRGREVSADTRTDTT